MKLTTSWNPEKNHSKNVISTTECKKGIFLVKSNFQNWSNDCFVLHTLEFAEKVIYLCYKIMFCHKVYSPWSLINDFFIGRKNVSISRSLCFCEIHNYKICDVTWSYTFTYFFWILSTIKMKLGQILVYLIANISNMFLTQYWRLETSSRSFYGFNEMTI